MSFLLTIIIVSVRESRKDCGYDPRWVGFRPGSPTNRFDFGCVSQYLNMKRTLKCHHLYVYNFKVFKHCNTPYLCLFNDHVNSLLHYDHSHVRREALGLEPRFVWRFLKNIQYSRYLNR